VQTCVQLGFDLFRGVTGFIVGMLIKCEKGSVGLLIHL
jgi:hypothetical protein